MGQIPTKKACQVEDLLSSLQNEPFVMVLIVFLIVIIAFLFMFPKFINDARSFNLASLKSSESGKLKLPNIKFSVEKMRKNWVAVEAAVIFMVVVSGRGCFLYIQDMQLIIFLARTC